MKFYSYQVAAARMQLLRRWASVRSKLNPTYRGGLTEEDYRNLLHEFDIPDAAIDKLFAAERLVGEAIEMVESQTRS